MTLHRDLDAAADDWRCLQEHGAGGPHDCLEWVQCWWTAVGRHEGVQPVIATGCNVHGHPRFLLPLGLRRSKGVARLEWLASAHGNYSGGLLHPEVWRETRGQPGPAILEALRPHLAFADVMHLDAVPASFEDCTGPLAGLPVIADASAGYALTVLPGAEGNFQTHLSKKARGNLKRSERRLSEHGELTFTQARGEDGIARVLKALFEQKQAWCRQTGVPDFLRDADVRAFYEALVRQPAGTGSYEPILFALAAGDEIIATNLGIRFGDSFYGLITTITQGNCRRHSPGNVLFRKMVEEMAGRGVNQVDWGAGDNGLKALWCTTRRERGHVVLALTAKGEAAAAAL
ncbi:MAG: GNAT family N-acetyltransferase, partial [Hyphomicrobiales bacterium]